MTLILGELNIVAKGYFYSMWFVGAPVMIAFIIGITFSGHKTIGQYYGFDNPADGIEIYPAWSNVLGMLCYNFYPIYF
jgi:hypothetical protein